MGSLRQNYPVSNSYRLGDGSQKPLTGIGEVRADALDHADIDGRALGDDIALASRHESGRRN
jgi:hypothetical protein